ncbi:MAG: DUF1566 domain-containing protein [Tatlockia sp.]|nr:DUF1566 domain-containing protein [Tatlockia sp.]
MTAKHYLAMGLALVAFANSASSATNPASTAYVDGKIATLRSELLSQFNLRFEGLTSSINQLPLVTHQIGEVFQGGIIFYVDNSKQHGLMVSLNDVEPAIGWRNGEGGDRTVNARAFGIGAGETNTRLIVAEQTIDEQEGRFAALSAANYQISADGKTPCAEPITADSLCYGGWYLPSVQELLLLHKNLKHALSNIAYWSSTEASMTEAWLVDFSSGEVQVSEKSTSASVRAIHAF